MKVPSDPTPPTPLANDEPADPDATSNLTRGKWLALILTLLLTAAGVFVLTQQATAMATATRNESLPSARAVLDRFVEVTGGVEAHRAFKSQRQTGTVQLAAMGVKGQLTILVAAPDHIAIVVEMPNLAPFLQGAAGEVAWSVDAYNGPKLLTDVERTLLQREIDPDEAADPYASYATATNVGIETVTGLDGPVQTYRLDLTTKDGINFQEWFAIDSGLRVKRAGTYQTDFGEERQEILYGDWRPVGDNGLLVPFTSQRIVLGAPIHVQIEQVEVDPKLPPGAFTPPPGVQELLDARN